MSNNTIIVDGNSLGHTAHHYQKRILPRKGNDFEIQAVGGFIEAFTSVYEQHSAEYPNIIVLWDGKSKYRNELYPEYKGTRRKTPEDIESDRRYKVQVPYIESFLSHIGVRQYKASDYEADDIAGYFVRRAEKDGRKILLVSNDHDWLQYVNQNTSCFSPKGGNTKVCSNDNFREFIDLSCKQFIQYKALLGDDSDNIIGIPGIGKKTALALLQEFGYVEDFLKDYKSEHTAHVIQTNVVLKRQRGKLLEFYESSELQENFALNMKLVNLLRNNFDNDMAQNIKYTNPKPDKQACIELLEDFNYGYHIKNISRWDCFFDKSTTTQSNAPRKVSNAYRP